MLARLEIFRLKPLFFHSSIFSFFILEIEYFCYGFGMKKELQILLDTPRLILRLPTEADSVQFQDFDERNIGHLSPWRSATGETPIDHRTQLTKWEQEFKEGKSIRFLLFLKDNPEGEIIGFCNFSQIFRGPFQACYLGYHIDEAFGGKGLMSEAVTKAIDYMFEKQKLHRIMANYMPSNERSARLLHKLGFVVEGCAKKYLLINGQWEDHILTSLTNENWLP
jgi:[ribosomal protein S5]-alanine N-acetyltransferase